MKKEEQQKIKKVKIDKLKIEVKEIDNILYFNYNDYEFALIIEDVNYNELCIYPKEWKIENRYALPSVIHYEENNIDTYISKGFKKLTAANDKYKKILLLKKVNNVTIHLNGSKKKILNPEDMVNSIHIVKEEEFIEYINHHHEFTEYEKYNIIFND